MKRIPSQPARTVILLVAAGSGLTGGAVRAADIRVEVTGSNIRRVDIEGALPVQVITRDAIEREGIQTAFGVVERLSQNSSVGGLNLANGMGGVGVGFATASLRGLGAQRTLVLLNGRRLANTAFAGTMVDINSIPLSAIDRVEVLTDGASAIYGSDAIAGVINFILRKDFTGGEAFAFYGNSDQGGGESQRYSLTGGMGDLAKDRYNVFATVDYRKIEGIAATQRPFSSTAYLPDAPGGVFDKTSGNSFPGNVQIPGVGARNPANPACLPPYSYPTVATPLQCRFDYTALVDLVPPSEAWTAYGAGRWQFHPDHQAFVEAAWSRNESTNRVSPSPIASSTLLSGQPVLTVPSSPYYPTALATQYGVNGRPLSVSWRSVELGPRTDFNTIEQTRIVGGLQGNLGGWEYTASLNWSQSTATDEWQAGWVRGSVLLPIINSGQINLFGFNTPEAVDLMRQALITGTVLDNKGTMTDVNLTASKEVYTLPAGPLAVAFGATYRRETFEQSSAEALYGGDVYGFGGTIPNLPEVKRNLWAAYGEANVPIAKDLEVNVALRYDDYESVGSTWNPKVSVRWQPVRQLLLRAAWGTGFRAPGLPELYLPNYFSATGARYSDPLRCPTTGSTRDCNTQFTTQLGGNPQLEAEQSDNFTAGFVFEPQRGLSMGVEYWNLRVKNIIGVKGEASIFGDIPAAEAAGLIVRYVPGSAGCPPSEQAGGLPCPILYGSQNNINLTEVQTSGIDFNLNWKLPPAWLGTFNVNFLGTYTIDWEQQEQGGTTVDLAGRFSGGVAATVFGPGSTGAIPRWKHNANLGWTYGAWSANLNQTFVNGYSEPLPGPGGSTRRVSSYSVWGLAGAYTGFRNWTLSLGVRNLLGVEPPYTRQTQTVQIGYDPMIADPTGRFYWGSVRYAFK